MYLKFLILTYYIVFNRFNFKEKKERRSASHRSTNVPLLRSSPGGLKGSWSCRTFPSTKVYYFYLFTKFYTALFYYSCFSKITPNSSSQLLTFLNNLLLKYLQFISYFTNFVKIFKEFFFIQHERNKFIEQSC